MNLTKFKAGLKEELSEIPLPEDEITEVSTTKITYGSGATFPIEGKTVLDKGDTVKSIEYEIENDELKISVFHKHGLKDIGKSKIVPKGELVRISRKKKLERILKEDNQ